MEYSKGSKSVRVVRNIHSKCCRCVQSAFSKGFEAQRTRRDLTSQMLFADVSGGLGMRREPPEEGLMCELLWSDPQAPAGRSPSKRGVGVAFGPDVTRHFLEDNKLQLLVRSHEARSIMGGLSLDLCLGLHLGSRARHLGRKSRGASGRAMACRRLCTRCAVLLRACCGLWAGTSASQLGRTSRAASWRALACSCSCAGCVPGVFQPGVVWVGLKAG